MKYTDMTKQTWGLFGKNPAPVKMASYIAVQELRKQAGLGTSIAIGAGLGALGGGLVSLLPTSTDKKKRLYRALMLMASGAIIGGSSGMLVHRARNRRNEPSAQAKADEQHNEPKTFYEKARTMPESYKGHSKDFDDQYAESLRMEREYPTEMEEGLPVDTSDTSLLGKFYLAAKDDLRNNEKPGAVASAVLDAAIESGLDIKALEREGFPYVHSEYMKGGHPLQNTMPASHYLNR